jgi:protein O-GlcNAc transferase
MGSGVARLPDTVWSPPCTAHDSLTGMSDPHGATDLVRAVTCPVCGHHVAVSLFGGDVEGTAIDAVRCVECGHAFNVAASSDALPPADRPGRAFIGAPGWREHVRNVRDETLARLRATPLVIEVGSGGGAYLAALAEARPAGRYVGFDADEVAEPPHAAVELRRESFIATRVLAEMTPDLIIARYVMEHLRHPLGFLHEIAFAAACANIQPLVYLEMPCLDRALEAGRTFDFAAAHASYFTTASLMRMLSRCGAVEQRIGHGYQKDVLYTFARFGRGQTQVQNARAADAFRSTAREALAQLRRQIDGIVASGRSIAIWGATGEAAAFIVHVGLDVRRIAAIVDADEDVIGTRVLATGHLVCSPEWLRTHPVDVVIIPAARQAAEVAHAMIAHDIRCDRVLVEHRGRLADYVADPRDLTAREACAAAAS